MNTPKHLPKLNTQPTQELKEKNNDQSKIASDHEYQKMILRVLDEVFPDD